MLNNSSAATGTAPGPAGFRDHGVVLGGSHQLPSIIAAGGNLVITAQDRSVTTVPGGHWEKGPSDIVSIASADGGLTWGPPRRLYDHRSPVGDRVCGYSSVLVMDGPVLRCVFAAGPENWRVDQLTVYQRCSKDGGLTWEAPTAPAVISTHDEARPTNGGKGFACQNGRLVIPGRFCVLFSDDHGAGWTATERFAGHMETKTVPRYGNGSPDGGALVAWRTQDATLGKAGVIGIAGEYGHRATLTTGYGSENNFGLCRYDASTLLMTVARRGGLYIRRSTDEGQSWAGERSILASAPSARYSDIAVTPQGDIVVVYMEDETDGANGARLRVVSFGMDWLLH